MKRFGYGDSKGLVSASLDHAIAVVTVDEELSETLHRVRVGRFFGYIVS